MGQQEPTYYDDGGWTGQRRMGEFWYLCRRCQRPKPRSQTVLIDELRYCLRCVDEQGRDDYREEAEARLRSATEREREEP